MTSVEAGAALLRRLLAEIAADRRALTNRTTEVQRFSTPVPAPPAERPAALALALDRAYTALESILERVARTLEGGAPVGEDCATPTQQPWTRTTLLAWRPRGFQPTRASTQISTRSPNSCAGWQSPSTRAHSQIGHSRRSGLPLKRTAKFRIGLVSGAAPHLGATSSDGVEAVG